MYSFEGDYRRKPAQSLGGASKQEQKSALLLRAQDARIQREALRNQIRSAVKIQACWRSAKVRDKQKVQVRALFDKVRKDVQKKTSVPVNDLSSLLHSLTFFFKSSKDKERLLWLCQVLIKQRNEALSTVVKAPDQTIHRISRLLLLCLQGLAENGVSQPIAIPMRMLEVYTDPETYSVVGSGMTAEAIVCRILHYLVLNGYYHYLKVLVDTRVPSSLEKTISPPTPVAASLLLLIVKPFSSNDGTDSQQLRCDAVISLCYEFFSGPYTEQVQNFILPVLIDQQTALPFADLLQAITTQQLSSANHKASYKFIDLKPSSWLLYAFVSLADSFMGSTTAISLDLMSHYINALQDWIQVLTNESDVIMDIDADSDSEDEQPSHELSSLLLESICLLNSTNHVKGFLKCCIRDPSMENLIGICRICDWIMSNQKCSIHSQRLLYSLAFNPQFIRSVWAACQQVSTTSATGSQSSLLIMLSHGLPMSSSDICRICPLMSTFSALYSHTLVSLDDAEFHSKTVSRDSSTPFAVHEVILISRYLRDVCLGIIKLAYPETRPVLHEDLQKAFTSGVVTKGAITARELQQRQVLWASLFKVTSNLVKQLYSRDVRHQFCPQDHWLSSHVTIMADQSAQIYKNQESLSRKRFGELSTLNRRNLDEEGPPMSNSEARNLTILTHLPFVVSFYERVKIFQRLLSKDKEEYQSDMSSFGLGPGIRVMVRRNYIYEDAFDKLSPENEPNLRLRMQVQLVNAAGLDEAGIDGGGVFREFLSQLLKAGFDPNRGFFACTTDSLLYPNPQSRILVEDFTKHYYFLGRMLGKALYENMLIELPFASFFLSKLLSYHSGDVDIHHLASLDPELFKNLMYLKNYDGDVANLDLDFTVVDNEFGETKVKELKPDGRSEYVTNDNRIEYVHLVAHYKLNKQIRAHTMAFRQGLADVVSLDWLRMFDYNELQVLISGAQISIDLVDMRKHTNYSGGFNDDHPVIIVFWQVLQSFTDEQRSHFLKFVTSCSRPPLLGFKDLFPAFCIHHGGKNAERLPTASTCMNLLKLPEFKTYDTMRSKLLYAIESGAGFELS